MIDLSDTLRAEGIKEPQPVREHVSSASADEIVITIEDESKTEAPEEPQRTSPFAWIRRK